MNLPDGWKEVALGEIAELRLGRTPPRKEARFWNDGRHPWVAISDLDNGAVHSTRELVSEAAWNDILNGKVAPAGTLLLSFKLTIGKVGILQMPAAHNEAIAAVFPDDMIADRDFLFFKLQTLDYNRYKDPYVKGATLSKKKLLALPLALPPLAEQRAIAHVLRTVQRAKKATEQVIAAAHELKSSLIEYLLVRNENRRGGSWPRARLGDHVDILVGYTFKSRDFSDDPSDIRLLRGANVGTGSLQWKDTKYWPREQLEQFDRYLIKEGDVILGMDRPWISTGFRCAVAGETDTPSLLVQRVARIRGTDRLMTEVVPHILNSRAFMRYLEPIMTGVSVPHISETQIANHVFDLPPTDVQGHAADFLERVERKIAAEESRHDALATLFDSLLHNLMTARLRVADLKVPA